MSELTQQENGALLNFAAFCEVQESMGLLERDDFIEVEFSDDVIGHDLLLTVIAKRAGLSGSTITV